ncbi:MAG: hypothetical protein ACLFUC_09910 [Bacteroidales bacterium]
MIKNFARTYNGIKLHIEVVLPDDPTESPASAILKCHSNYLGALRNNHDFLVFLENIIVEGSREINPEYKLVYTNNDFFGEKELSIKAKLGL